MANRRRSVWPWATCLWPGLPQLWWRGDSLGLAAAVLLAMLVNMCIAASWVWPELLTPGQRACGWLVAGGVWLACLPWSWWAMRAIAQGSTGGEALLIAAQTAYLKGNWVEVETLLKRQLRLDPRDIESRLLLAALCRRTERWEEAQRQLRRLSRLDAAEPWRGEIAQEQQRIAEILAPEPPPTEETSTTEEASHTEQQPANESVAEPQQANEPSSENLREEPRENQAAPAAVESTENNEETPTSHPGNRHAA